MNKAKVIYVRHEDGSQPALDTILYIGRKGKQGDQLFQRMSRYIVNGLLSIERTGVEDWHTFDRYIWVTTNEKGFKVTFTLIKKLEHNKPLFEFRINQRRFPNDRKEDGYAFRMVFFTHRQNNLQYILCTNAIIKRSRSSAAFEAIVQEGKRIYKDFLRNPFKYLKGV